MIIKRHLIDSLKDDFFTANVEESTALILDASIVDKQLRVRFEQLLNHYHISFNKAEHDEKSTYIIDKFDDIRKLAVLGFEFRGADVLRLQEQRLAAAEGRSGWSPPPIK